MGRHAHIRGRLANNRAWLRHVLEHVTPDLVGWSPAEGMRTIGGQLAEILAVEIPLVPLLRDGKRIGWEEADALVGDMADMSNLLAKLESTRRETLEYLDSLSPEELEAGVSEKCWFGTYWTDPMPRAEIFVNVAEHEFYHVGQLIAYMWSRGDDPYKW